MAVRRAASTRWTAGRGGWRRAAVACGSVLLTPVAPALVALPAQSASSKACDGGGYELVDLASNPVVASARTGDVAAVIPAARLGSEFLVRGRYNGYRCEPPTSRCSTTSPPAHRTGWT